MSLGTGFPEARHPPARRGEVVGAARDLVVALLGESVYAALQGTGAIGASLVIVGFVLAAVSTVAGIRRLAAAGRH